MGPPTPHPPEIPKISKFARDHPYPLMGPPIGAAPGISKKGNPLRAHVRGATGGGWGPRSSARREFRFSGVRIGSPVPHARASSTGARSTPTTPHAAALRTCHAQPSGTGKQATAPPMPCAIPTPDRKSGEPRTSPPPLTVPDTPAATPTPGTRRHTPDSYRPPIRAQTPSPTPGRPDHRPATPSHPPTATSRPGPEATSARRSRDPARRPQPRRTRAALHSAKRSQPAAPSKPQPVRLAGLGRLAWPADGARRARPLERQAKRDTPRRLRQRKAKKHPIDSSQVFAVTDRILQFYCC